MKAVGIITEYNPFHEGHILHINESRRLTGADVVVCIMSPDFVQRGEPAIADKFVRAKMAVCGGVDLVAELPVEAALSSAEGFAKAAVLHLHELGVSSVCFGCEDADIETLKSIADILLAEPAQFKDVLKSHLACGKSFAEARQLALASYTGNADIASVLEKPNNTLGIEYIKAIKKYNFDIEPVCIRRDGAGYNDTSLDSDTIPSATALRKFLCEQEESALNQKFESTHPSQPEYNCLAHIRIPESTRQILYECSCFPVTFNDFGYVFYEKLETKLAEAMYDKERFMQNMCRTNDLSADTAARIYNIYSDLNIKNHFCPLEEFAANVKTKQYALSRIKRNIMRFALDIDTIVLPDLNDEQISSDNANITDTSACSYIRVIGFSKKGQQYLSSIRDTLNVPLIAKVADQKALYLKQLHAHNIYRQICQNKFGTSPVSDYAYKPFIL